MVMKSRMLVQMLKRRVKLKSKRPSKIRMRSRKLKMTNLLKKKRQRRLNQLRIKRMAKIVWHLKVHLK